MHDIRDGVRALRASPIVTAVAVLSLALGIGANTAIFSILDSLMLRALPVQDPARLAMVRLGSETTSWTNPVWEALRERQEAFDGALAWSSTRFNLAQGGQTDFVDGIWASGGYFEVLGVPAILGRTFGPADDRRGGGPDGPVAVISYEYWQRRFGGRADVIGQPLVVERVTYSIAGVTGPGFFGTEVGRKFDVAIPLGTEPLVRGRESGLDRRDMWWLSILIRTKPDQDIEAATAALRGLQPRIRDATMPDSYREEDRKSYLAEAMTMYPAATGNSRLRRQYQTPLTAILVVVALVLLIACANIANLLLARAAARRHELSVRVALGASRWRVARQLLAESLLLSGLGAALGLVVAWWGSRILVRQLSTATNTVFLDLGLDWRVLGFTAAAAVGTALLFGVAPALRATRVRPSEAMKEQGRSVSGEPRLGLGNLLVVAQVALSLVLVVAAGLFIGTFSSLASLDPGFDRAPVLVASVNAQRLQLEPAVRADFFHRLRLAAASVPAVEAAAASSVTPISGSTWQFGLDRVDGVELPKTPDARRVFVNLISPDWFRTYGTRLLGGRDFTDADTAASPRVVIVNEAFARKFTGGRNPLGHRLWQMGGPGRPGVEREIIGYVEDAVYRSLREAPPATMYIPVPQQGEPPSFINISVRAASGSPALLTRGLASALTAVHGDLAITFRPLEDQVNASLVQERVVAMLAGFFGALAILLAGIGLYGVTSYAVSRRRTEIGIRMALGAAPGGVVRMVLRRVLALVCLGIVSGAAVSLWASGFVSALLYGLEPREPAAFAAAAAILASIGALAGWLPARRASRIDPASVLRE